MFIFPDPSGAFQQSHSTEDKTAGEVHARSKAKANAQADAIRKFQEEREKTVVEAGNLR